MTASQPQSATGLITCPTRPCLFTQGIRSLNSITKHFSTYNISHSTSAFATILLQPAWRPKHLIPSTSAAQPRNHQPGKMKLLVPPNRAICGNCRAIYYNSTKSHSKWGATELQGLWQVRKSSMYNTWLIDQEGKAATVQTHTQIIRGLFRARR